MSREEARQIAIDWQLNFDNHTYTWSELERWCRFLEKLAMKYGLEEEFYENGIL